MIILVSYGGNLWSTRVYLQDAQPTTALAGDLWVDTTSFVLYVYNGSSWTQVGEAPTDSHVYPYSTTIGDYALTPTDAAASSSDVTPAGASDWTENFNSNTGFTQVGTGVDVDSTVVDKLSLSGSQSAERRVHKALGLTLNDTQWIADFVINNSGCSNNGSVFFPVLFSNSTTHIKPNTNNVDFLGFGFSNSSGIQYAILGYKDGTGAKTYSSQLTISTGVIYVRLQRTSTTNLRCYVWTGSFGGTLVGQIDLTIPSSVTGLNTFQATINGDDGTIGSITCTVDDLVVYDNEPAPPYQDAANVKDGNTSTKWKSANEANPVLQLTLSASADKEPAAMALYLDKSLNTLTAFTIDVSADGSTWYTVRTITLASLTTNAYNYFRWNRHFQQNRYVRLRGTSTGVLSVTEVKLLSPTESQWNRRQGTKAISPTSQALALTA